MWPEKHYIIFRWIGLIGIPNMNRIIYTLMNGLKGQIPLVYLCKIGKDGEAFGTDSQIFSYWQEEPMPVKVI